MNTNDDGLPAAAPRPVVWMTGLPGAGKTTIAQALFETLQNLNAKAIVLDGDTLRAGICSDLGFSEADRIENIRRIAHLAKLFQREGYVVIVATISPFAQQRALARSIVGDGFIETFISAPPQLCAERDPKGMYAQAREGRIQQFTGVSSPYEPPVEPELVIDTSACRVEGAVATIVLRLGKGVRGRHEAKRAACNA
ncbi:adenylyl-sulfate kinase [Paraburkholderia kururiensis]|uniref:adenylyl-sulfate kinase n=2 Tax=Paraburkholderia kururiensis TaxID=984307 RepID=UPI00398AB028